MKNRQAQFLRIPFVFKGRSSAFHLDIRLAEVLKRQLGDQLAACIQRQADAIVAERSGISWLELHRRLQLAIAQPGRLVNPERSHGQGGHKNLSLYLLNTTLLANGPEQVCLLGG